MRILDRLNGPYMLPLIEQQITGIVSRFYSKTTRYGTAARNQRCSLEWKLIMKQKKKKTDVECDVNKRRACFNRRIKPSATADSNSVSPAANYAYALTIPVTNVIIARVYTHHRNYR